ncbi:nucleic acid/nucleotide deaminase domain-containing protein [Streptomyces sp. NBC_00690]|uniref:nucleic acid/nucleotide deaminase domain-containing protein n=1 Tax=Streptomyces sp. NBC_00690 TaxID=2975808 RepID=UPI002E299991|nr:nucleic acid/nucleotide deaminase domain-containing protein [Streptomyces sp. NBC_00690]
MSSLVPDRAAVVAHFGVDGLRRLEPGWLRGAMLPEAARGLLEATGVPRSVGFYFRAPADDEPGTLGSFAAHRARPDPPAVMAAWPRIGGDGMADLCARPDGAVQAVMPTDVGSDRFVSSSLESLNASLLVLDRELPVIATASGLAEAASAFRELHQKLREIDTAAFSDRENWWPRVLDDVRHTLNFPFSATFEYVDGSGGKRVVTESTGPGQPHPEEMVWRRLVGEGVSPGQVRRVYCELEPCLMPGHYCAVWMQQTFPDAQFSHSFDYGDTAVSREEGFKELIVHAARQARGR